MTGKVVVYQESSRKVLEAGMDVLAVAVSITLGPRGRNVVLGKKFLAPQIVNDGVTIAKEIDIAENFKKTGVCLIRQAAYKTNIVAGDGTTTATVLAYAIIKQGIRNVAAGANPIGLKRGIEEASKFVIGRIPYFSSPLRNSYDVLKQVATVSAGNNPEVGSLIANAFAKIGREGFIFIEESKFTSTELKIIEGMSFDQGFISGYFVTNQNRMETVLENSLILLTDKKITSMKKDLLPTLEVVTKKKQALLIISDKIEKEVLATLILNKMRGILTVVAVRAPGFGVRRKALLSDLAVLTGGRVITSDAGYSLQNTEIEYLGLARRIIIRKESTTIISDGKRSEVLERCSQLRRDLEKSKDSYEREKIQERLSRLCGGVAVIRVGGATETERKDRKLRLEDAVNAVKAAFEEGCLPGGGAVLANFSKELFNWAKVELTGDELVGSLIVEKALSAPFKKILSNAGQNGELVFEKASKMDFVVGYDASTSSTQFVNLFDIGIVDPVKVTRLALQNATSIASMVLTTECLILGSSTTKV